MLPHSNLLRRRAGAFDNEAARTDPQSTLATVARLQGNQAAKAVRRIALGEAERQRALCNTPEGLRQCHRVIEFLVDLHHRVALDCKGLLTVEARAGRLLWAEAYLSGMRYGVHRTLVKLFDQLSLDHGKTKVCAHALHRLPLHRVKVPHRLNHGTSHLTGQRTR